MRSRVKKVDSTDKRLCSADNVVGEDQPSCPVTGDVRNFQNVGIVSGISVAEQVMGVG